MLVLAARSLRAHYRSHPCSATPFGRACHDRPTGPRLTALTRRSPDRVLRAGGAALPVQAHHQRVIGSRT